MTQRSIVYRSGLVPRRHRGLGAGHLAGRVFLLCAALTGGVAADSVESRPADSASGEAEPTEVRIGYFGPDDPDHPIGGDVWLAARLAVEHANAAGGPDGATYRLMPVWSENRWGSGAAAVARLVFEDGVRAIVGSIDGASTHLAEQVVAKAQLALVGAADTDVTVDHANVSWMFSTLPGDDALARRLAERIERDGVGDRLSLLVATDHDSRAVAAALSRALWEWGFAPAHRLDLEPGAPAPPEVVERLRVSAAVAVLAGPLDSARWTAAVRRERPDMAVYGGPSMARRAFLERAGAAAEGVSFPLPCDARALSSDLATAFRERFGRDPDCATVQTYDATRMLIEAITTAGLDRTAIRDRLRALSPWRGHAGSIEWGPTGRNVRPVHAATVREGRVVVVDPRSHHDGSREGGDEPGRGG